MSGERIPRWVPVGLAAVVVGVMAFAAVRPALDEAEAADRESDRLEIVAGRGADATRDLDRARSAAEADAALPITRASFDLTGCQVDHDGDGGIRFARTARFDQLQSLLAAIDALPRRAIRSIEITARGNGRVTLDATVDALFVETTR